MSEDGPGVTEHLEETQLGSGGLAGGEYRRLLSVIVPARNEEACIGQCLRSLTIQSVDGFELGLEWELLLVDDDSTDGTRQVVEGFRGITLIEPGSPPGGWTGKANAVWSAAKVAEGRWLLFTDADTVHQAGNLRRAIHEAEKAEVAMLSYSPRQIVKGFWQRALMPLIFSELALAYPPHNVSDPNSRLAAANGQFLLIRRDAYARVGGHEAVANSILEDVDLAKLVKRGKLGLRFRYAPDAISTQMYRTVGQMLEGWSKNLALLFGNCLSLAGWRLLDLALLLGLPALAIAMRYRPLAMWALLLLWVRALWRFFRRVGRSHFPAGDCALSVFGLPLFAVVLVRSWFDHTIRRRVAWKGREYPA